MRDPGKWKKQGKLTAYYCEKAKEGAYSNGLNRDNEKKRNREAKGNISKYNRYSNPK